MTPGLYNFPVGINLVIRLIQQTLYSGRKKDNSEEKNRIQYSPSWEQIIFSIYKQP